LLWPSRDDDDTIDLPENCYKSDLTIKNNTDLSLLLGTLRFWGVDIMPREVILYVIWKKPQEIIHSAGDYVRELTYLPFLQALCAKAALSCGESASDYYGLDANVVWSTDPAEAAAQICLIHYDNADGDIWTADTTALAARLGQLHALKFLHGNGCPWNASACSSAASGGHLSCLQYAHEHGCRWDAETACTAAAKAGKLECLQYLFERECSWDAATAHAAVVVGTLDCLKYAYERGCPWVVPEMLAIPLTVKSRRYLEYVREQAPAEAAAYDASILARQKSHEEERLAFRYYITSQLSKVLNEATWARGEFSVESQENKSLFGFIYTYTIRGPAAIGADALPALASLLFRNLDVHNVPLPAGARSTINYTHPLAPCYTAHRATEHGPGEIEAATRPQETRHQRYVRRWQEKQTRLAQARGQPGGKRTAARKTGKTGAGRGVGRWTLFSARCINALAACGN
jgi:hypothetical protein